MSGAGNRAAFDALVARLTARISRRLAERSAARRPDMARQLAESRWRSAEDLWPDFAPSIHRASKD